MGYDCFTPPRAGQAICVADAHPSMSHFHLVLDAPITFAIAVSLSLSACAFAVLRRVHLPPSSIVLTATALLLLSLAAGNFGWTNPAPPRIAVMIDVSSSTRTATYHDTANLTQRVQQLLGDAPFTAYFFSDHAIATAITDHQVESS